MYMNTNNSVRNARSNAEMPSDCSVALYTGIVKIIATSVTVNLLSQSVSNIGGNTLSDDIIIKMRLLIQWLSVGSVVSPMLACLIRNQTHQTMNGMRPTLVRLSGLMTM